ncbi:hypothetical protein AB0I60_31085 [Actinosynnema sp. NPDC050436]|uniref:hypothetical protein n=1 Tax=Actinosynnema sp. NPDC050436 TaxID=3155659 RepID=UPI0033E4EE27
MTESAPEVARTSRRSAGWAKVIGAATALGVGATVVYGVVETGSWWLSAIVAVCGALAVLIVWGMMASVAHDAEKTAALEAAGTRVRATVVRAERADDVVHEVVLRIPLPDGSAFDVEHRCSHYSCAAATREAATARPVIVDPATRAWAVVH